jgi:hypothetical protein
VKSIGGDWLRVVVVYTSSKICFEIDTSIRRKLSSWCVRACELSLVERETGGCSTLSGLASNKHQPTNGQVRSGASCNMCFGCFRAWTFIRE